VFVPFCVSFYLYSLLRYASRSTFNFHYKT
jgi:hypothetical protein